MPTDLHSNDNEAHAPEFRPPGPEQVPRESFWQLAREALRGSDRDFARLDLRRAIPLLAIPMVLEMAMESIFAVADVFFVSKLGPDAVATVGLTESIITLIFALAIGIAMPVTAMVARRFGEGDTEGAARVAGQAIWLGLGISLLIGIPAPFFAKSLLAAMGAEASVIESGWGFTAVLTATNAVIMLLFINNAIFRGAGDAAHAMRALWLANGINLVLDPCLIFGLGPFPEMGVTGAAVATSIGRGCGVLYQLRVLGRGPRITLSRSVMRPDLSIVRKLASLSVGGVAQYLVATASWIGLVRILASFGSVAVAGYTVAIRIVIFCLLPSWGFANATATLVGQSLGAKNPDRAARAVLLSGVYNMIFLGTISLAFIFAARPIAGILTDDVAVLDYAAEALMIISLGYVFYAWEMVLVSSFNGAGDTRTPTYINLICFWAVEIPLAWWLAHVVGWGPTGVFASVAFAYSLAACVAFVWFRRGGWRNVDV